MKVDAIATRESAPRVTFEFDGSSVEARQGDTIASALLAHGRRKLRTGSDGTPRGLFCGIGVCFECVVSVDGDAGSRACLVFLREGMVVKSIAS